MIYINDDLKHEVPHARALEELYSKDKPIRKVTTEYLGGEERHKIRPYASFLRVDISEDIIIAERRQLAAEIVKLLREHGTLTSQELSDATGANRIKIGLAARTIDNLRHGVDGCGRQKIYWLRSSNPTVYSTKQGDSQ